MSYRRRVSFGEPLGSTGGDVLPSAGPPRLSARSRGSGAARAHRPRGPPPPRTIGFGEVRGVLRVGVDAGLKLATISAIASGGGGGWPNSPGVAREVVGDPSPVADLDALSRSSGRTRENCCGASGVCGKRSSAEEGSAAQRRPLRGAAAGCGRPPPPAEGGRPGRGASAPSDTAARVSTTPTPGASGGRMTRGTRICSW